MLFNSVEFLVFFVLVSTFYFFIPHLYRVPLLLVSSCVFYMAYIPSYILILFFVIGIDYYMAILIQDAVTFKRKLYLIISIVANLGILALFKYANLIVESMNFVSEATGSSFMLPALALVLPIGLSFHTFQAMSYTLEVYKGRQQAERNLLVYSLYVLFYPQMVAGPIERPQNLLPQFKKEHFFNYERVVDGLKLMAWGMFKKVVIADRLAIVVNEVYNQPQQYEGLILWVATLFFTFQIYCDFSGYSDIALGAAKVLGFDLMKNFDRPYISSSISEFWRRWHISLSTWFKDYVYLPLGGNRSGIAKWCFNIVVVFLLSGIWHGANVTFVIWGLVHSIFYVVYILLKSWFPIRLPAFIGIVLTFSCVFFSWIFFRAQTIHDAYYIFSHLIPNIGKSCSYFLNAVAQGNSISEAFRLEAINFTNSQWFISIGLIAGMFFFQLLSSKERAFEKLKKQPFYVRWSIYYAFIAIILVLGKFDNRDFIYFQF